MADMDGIRRAMKDAHDREFGDDDARMARFRERLENFLTPSLFQSFGFTFGWSEGGARGREPEAKADLKQSFLWFYEGTDGYAFDLSLMGKNVMALTSRRHVDSKDEFLNMLDGWT